MSVSAQACSKWPRIMPYPSLLWNIPSQFEWFGQWLHKRKRQWRRKNTQMYVRAAPERSGEDFISFQSFISSRFFAHWSTLSVSYLLFTIFHLGFYRFSTTLQAVICFYSLRQENELIFRTCLKIESPTSILFSEQWLCPPTRQFAVVINMNVCSAQLLPSTNYKETWISSIYSYRLSQNTRHSQELLLEISSVNITPRWKPRNSFCSNLTSVLTIIC